MILLRLGLRNLRLQRFKTLVIGAVLVIGSAFMVVALCILRTIERRVETTVTEAIVGDAQLYSSRSRDRFFLYDSVDGFVSRPTMLEQTPRVVQLVGAIPGVRAVVPMAIHHGQASTRNFLEGRLAELRSTLQTPSGAARLDGQKARIRLILDRLAQGMAGGTEAEARRDLERARSASFWAGFDRDPIAGLEFLENRIGPLALEEEELGIRYIGADPALFARAFPRFEIVKGETVPPGERGFLFNEFFYNESLKDRIAANLDLIAERVADGERIARCAPCRRWIRENTERVYSLLYQLDADATREVSAALGAHLGTPGVELAELLQRFLTVDDRSFAERYRIFNQVIAPRIRLYRVAVGEELVLTAYSPEGGYARRVAVKVHGVFRFRGLDRAQLAGRFNLIDPASFGELFGQTTEAMRREQDAIRREVGVPTLGSKAEAERLFDRDAADLPAPASRATSLPSAVAREAPPAAPMVLSAAVVFDPAPPARRQQLLAEIRGRLAREGLPVAVSGWREASGRVGQLIRLLTVILYAGLGVILLVTLVVIANAIIISIAQRTREIGTMRAIGATRGFVVRMLLVESIALTSLCATIGAGLGMLLVQLLHGRGITAWNQFSFMLFGGLRLHPEPSLRMALVALLAFLGVAIGSTLWPALVAVKITPREAMVRED